MSGQPMRSYQTTFLFNCRILLILYVIELYNHLNRAIRPSYGSSFKYSWMYVSGGLIMNIIGFCKIKKRAKICEYVMYIVNGFIYIGAAIVLLVFHAQVGLHYIVQSKMYHHMQKMSNTTCQKEAINELSKLINSPVDPLNDDWPTQPHRHEDDTFSDMIFALVIWLCIMFLTVLNVIVAIIEIKRLKSASQRSTLNSTELAQLHDRVNGVLGWMMGQSVRNQGPCDSPPTYDETCPDRVEATTENREDETVNVDETTALTPGHVRETDSENSDAETRPKSTTAPETP